VTSGGNSFNDFPETVPTREITTDIGKTFVVFSSVAVGLFLEWSERCSISSTHLSPALGPDLQNILRQSYDYLTIMPKLRSTYDRRLIYKTSSAMNGKLFMGKIHVQNRNIVGDSVRKSAFDIPDGNFSTF